MGKIIGSIGCLSVAAIFLLIGIVFAGLKEKSAVLISGFNSLSREERKNYDTKKMSEDMRNSLFLWSGILLAGGILSYFVDYYFAIIAGVIWLELFFKNVHLDVERAFSKYKK